MRDIDHISNDYGSLKIKSEEGKYYWGIDNYDGLEWQQIPEYLYNALNKHQDEIDKLWGLS